MDNNLLSNNTGKSWSLEYTFVCAVALLIAARKLFIDPSMDWSEVILPFVVYYLMIFAAGVVKFIIELIAERLSKEE